MRSKDPGSHPASYALNIFWFTGILRHMYSNVHHLKILELYSPYTVETTPEKYGPYTFCTGTMRSICRNYPLNLKQWYGNFHYFFYCRLFMTEIVMVISFSMLNSSLLTFLQHFFLFLRNTQNEFYYFFFTV